MKFWRSSRKVKALQEGVQVAIEGQRGKKQHVHVPTDFSDSDSDFESPKKLHIDLTADSNVTLHPDNGRTTGDCEKLDAIGQRLQNIEAELILCSDVRQSEAQLREQVARMEAENRTMKRSVNDMKECLSCLVCKTVAAFPWKVTPCCSVLMCQECAERWFSLQQTCPHCRTEVNVGTCQEVRSIRSLEHHITIWRADVDNNEQPQVD